MLHMETKKGRGKEENGKKTMNDKINGTKCKYLLNLDKGL